MADNIAVTAGTGTTVATDDIAGVHYQRVKLTQGADGSATDVSSAAPLQVTLANGTVPSHAVTNAGTFAVQVDGAALTALQKIDDPVLVDDAAFTPASSSVMMVGATFDNTATDSVD